jgi:release factor glutamine methyltransferase
LKVLEIATGSGAVALALINKIQQLNYLNKNWEFCLSELSAPAMLVAKNNYQELLAKVVDQDKIKVKFVQSNLLDQIKNEEKFDLVLANLPYIPSQDLKKLDPSVKNFEPLLALDGGETGFELIAKTLEQLIKKNFLNKDALLIFESNCTHTEKFIKNHYPGLLDKFEIKFIKDQFARQRFLQLQRI